MKPFFVLAPGRFMNEPGINVTIKSFSSLYHNVTPKHQRRLRLIIIEAEDQIPLLRQQLSAERFSDEVVHIVSRQDIENAEAAYQNASLFFLPIDIDGYKVIPEALSFGLPVLTFDNPNIKTLLDNTCSMLVRSRSVSNAHEEFSRMLEMLYFDPEVRKILSKGAMDKYARELH